MTQASNVKVTELSPDSPEVKNARHGTVLGNQVIEAKLAEIWDGLRGESRVFLLEWIGSNVPRGAIVNGQEITYTQQSQVISNGARIGTYDRLVDGAVGEQHKMLVYLSAPKRVFQVEHRGPGGDGKGACIVVAVSAVYAVGLAETYLRYKKGGSLQTLGVTLEAKPFDVANSPVPIDRNVTGVQAELLYKQDNHGEPEVVFAEQRARR